MKFYSNVRNLVNIAWTEFGNNLEWSSGLQRAKLIYRNNSAENRESLEQFSSDLRDLRAERHESEKEVRKSNI